MIEAFKGEMMLLGWAESSNRGRTVTFLLDESTEEHPFKHFTIKSGKRAGQRFAVMMVQIDSNEEPEHVEQKPSQLAATIGKDPQFWQFACERGFENVNDEVTARNWICEKLRITSRSELDHDDYARAQFEQHIVRPFNEYRHAVNNPL